MFSLQTHEKFMQSIAPREMEPGFYQVHWFNPKPISGFPGMFGMMHLSLESKNNQKSFVRNGQEPLSGGMVILPIGREIKQVDEVFAAVGAVQGQGFTGRYVFQGNTFYKNSHTADFAQATLPELKRVASSLLKMLHLPAVLIKHFDSGNIYVMTPEWKEGVVFPRDYSNVVAWLPHTSVFLPGTPTADLRRDAHILADWRLEEIWNFLPSPLTSDYSRFAVDLERYANDKKEPMAQAGMGVLYNRLIDGIKFDRKILGPQKRLVNYYEKQHKRLKKAVLQAGEGALLLDLHSFCPAPLPCDRDKSMPRPDICLGFNDDLTAPDSCKLRAVKTLLTKRGYRVAINSPFVGAMTTPVNIRYTALMIEINKKLYLPEAEIFAPSTTREKQPLLPNAQTLREALQDVVEILLEGSRS